MEHISRMLESFVYSGLKFLPSVDRKAIGSVICNMTTVGLRSLTNQLRQEAQESFQP